jgi:hypothetical protein
MKEYGEILLGIVLVVLGAAGIWNFLDEVIAVILGVVGIVALIVGAVFLMIGVSDVREKLAEKKGESGEESAVTTSEGENE